MSANKIGLLTGGGDCPGLNAAIRAVVRRAQRDRVEVLGIRNGWLGLLTPDVEPLTADSVSGILPKGGTILGSSRKDPLRSPEDRDRLMQNVARFALDALIVIGGEGTLATARDAFDAGLEVIGIPKTIDNDLHGTDWSFGFDTAVNTVREAIDRLHSTAESHHRVMVVEVMGHRAGWLAAMGGLAGGADYILIPEKPYRADEMCNALLARWKRGRSFSIVVVAEGAHPEGEDPLPNVGFGHSPGIGMRVAREIEERMKVETRVTILGHVQRGGSPTAFDRVLATRLGIGAVELALAGRFGHMIGLQGNQLVAVPLHEATAGPRTLDLARFADAELFFG